MDVHWSIANNLTEIPPDKNDAYFIKKNAAYSHIC
jgi:hypothetical protein